MFNWPLTQRQSIARSPSLYFSNILNRSWFIPSGDFQLNLSGLLHQSIWVCKCVWGWLLYSDDERNSSPQSLQLETIPDDICRVLLLMKQDIEQNIISIARSLKYYEEALLLSKESPESLAVEQCKTYVAAVVNTIEYLDAISSISEEPIIMVCPTCRKDSLLIPKILY